MKQYILPWIAAAFLLFACNNNKKPSGIAAEDNKAKVTVDSAALQKLIDNLQDLSPLNTEELKSLLPEELTGAKGSNYQAEPAVGTNFASADYKLNDSTEIKLSIWDCGGPGGAGYYNRQYIMLLSDQQDNENRKIIDFNGQSALEECQKKNNRCSFTYFNGSRFLVVLEGWNVDAEGLKKSAAKLKLK
jgi:GTPase SAR1 family protein